MFTLQSGHEVDTTVFLRKEMETGTSRWVLNSFVLSLIVIATVINRLLELYYFAGQ